MITFKNKYDGSLVMSQQTHAQEVTSHFPVARLVTIGHFQSEQSLVVVAQWEEHALSVSPYYLVWLFIMSHKTGKTSITQFFKIKLFSITLVLDYFPFYWMVFFSIPQCFLFCLFCLKRNLCPLYTLV